MYKMFLLYISVVIFMYKYNNNILIIFICLYSFLCIHILYNIYFNICKLSNRYKYDVGCGHVLISSTLSIIGVLFSRKQVYNNERVLKERKFWIRENRVVIPWFYTYSNLLFLVYLYFCVLGYRSFFCTFLVLMWKRQDIHNKLWQ